MITDLSHNSARHRGLITLSIMLATIMQVIDTTIVNVALPHMQGSMSATTDQITWVLTSYIVAAAIMTPLTGVLAGRFGRKTVFAWSVVGFTIASMLCGSATSLEQIVIYRVLQGIVGASLVPLSQAVLLDTYPTEKHGSAMALWGMGVMVGPILGPTLGGYLTEYYSWRWAFYINVPLGVLALLGILAFVPQTQIQRRGRFDFFGFALLSLAIGALQMVLDRGNTLDWFSSPEIVITAAASGLAFYLFLTHTLTTDNPFIEPELFRDRNYVAGLTLMFVVGVMLLATLALLPPFLQNLLGYPVVTAGLVLAPRGFGTLAAMLVVGQLVNRIDTRGLVLFGLVTTAFSMWVMTGFNLEVGIWEIVWTGIVQGVGIGFIFVPLSTMTFSTLPPRLRNEGTAMYSLIRNLGASIGISYVMTLLSQGMQTHHARLAEHVTLFRDALKWLPQTLNPDTNTGVIALNAEVTRQAAMLSYLGDFRFMLYMSLLAVPLLLLIKPPNKPSRKNRKIRDKAPAAEEDLLPATLE